MLAKIKDFTYLWGLVLLKYALYVLIAPFAISFMLFGIYFVTAGALLLVLISIAFVIAILIFTVSFFMFFVALFEATLWTTIGNMWNWLWTWFSNGTVAIWPHLVRSFLPYFIPGVIFISLGEVINHLNRKIKRAKSV